LAIEVTRNAIITNQALKYLVDKNVNNLFYIDLGEASYSIILAPKLRKINKPSQKKALKK
jgi:hypothetical protein